MISYLNIHVLGGLLLGAGSFESIDSTTLKDSASGLPFIPGSAIKGVIRQQMIGLCGKEATADLLGRAGIRPKDPPLADAASQDQPSRSLLSGETRVYFTDARLTPDTPARQRFAAGHGYSLRSHVSIDRRSRRAANQRLYEREILAPFAGDLIFRSEVETTEFDEDEWRRLRGAIRAVFVLGASSTSGLGRVRFELVQSEALQGATVRQTRSSSPEIGSQLGQDVEILLEALDPVCVGSGRFVSNFRHTLGHLSGSTLRGAIATAGLITQNKAHLDQRGDPGFRRLFFDPKTCIRFGDAWPVEDSDHAFGRDLRPAPLTLRTCKAHGQDHGIVDHLLRAYCREVLSRRSIASTPREICSEISCGERLVRADGPIGAIEPKRRLITRNSIDVASGRAEDGKLFTIEVLERKTRFVAPIHGLDEQGRTFLQDAASRPLRVGHGRGQGYGRVRILDVRPSQEISLQQRLESFDKAFQANLDHLAALCRCEPEDLASQGFAFSVTLLSDLAPESEGGAEEALLKSLGLESTEILYGQVKTSQRGGWEVNRPMGLFPILLAGSVLLLRTAIPLADLEPQLASLEQRGAGRSRHLGLGWLRFSDPIHTQPWSKP